MEILKYHSRIRETDLTEKMRDVRVTCISRFSILNYNSYKL